jgi:Secretory lipase
MRRLIALAFLILPAVALASGPTQPSKDPFYKPPRALASYAPGAILRWRNVTLAPTNRAASTTAYELLYRTTSATGKPIATVTTLMLPAVPAPGARKLLSYQTAEDSLTTRCAPSYTMRGGNNGGSTQWAESQEVTDGLAHGWDVVVPDYQGPRSEWAVGPLEGLTTLDSIRAVEHFTRAHLEGARTPVAMIGYSGGSIPTLWANSLARRYAPSLHLVAAASGGNVPNPIENLNTVNGGPFAGTIIGVSVAIDRAYPQLRLSALLNAKGRALAAKDGRDASGCAGSVTNAPGGTIAEYSHYKTPQALEALPRVGRVFKKLDLIGGPLPEAPSYLYQEIHDELAIIKPVDQLVANDCSRGARIDYYRNPAGEHLTGAGAYVAPAFQYIAARFAGKPAPDTCPAH